MRRLNILCVVVAVLLGSQVHESTCWGGWSNIGSEISRGVAHVTQQVTHTVAQVQREVERVGVQIADVATDAVKETERFGETIGESVGDIFKPLEPESIEYPIIDVPSQHAVRTKCWPLGGITVDFACNLAGNKVNCGSPVEVGTVALVSCKPGHKLPEDYPGPTTITCNATFEWSSTVRRCIPDCGKRNVAEAGGSPDIDVRSLGRQATTAESPWHVGIYKPSGGEKYSHVCGGSLITQTLALTAAACFWDVTANKKNENANQFKVVGGKYYRDWDFTEAGHQRRDIADVFVHERFRGRVRVSAYNVALVKLTEQFSLTPTVNVVCVDWRNTPDETKLAAADDGIVSSWADNDVMSESDVNDPKHLTYLPFLTCSDTIDEDYQVYLTSDKICGATSGKDVLVCPGDAGVGYVFPLDTVLGPRYYLRGVASSVLNATAEIEGRCDKQRMALFTHFHGYREWVQKIVLQK